jgi:hypothetical protein
MKIRKGVAHQKQKNIDCRIVEQLLVGSFKAPFLPNFVSLAYRTIASNIVSESTTCETSISTDLLAKWN